MEFRGLWDGTPAPYHPAEGSGEPSHGQAPPTFQPLFVSVYPRLDRSPRLTRNDLRVALPPLPAFSVPLLSITLSHPSVGSKVTPFAVDRRASPHGNRCKKKTSEEIPVGENPLAVCSGMDKAVDQTSTPTESRAATLGIPSAVVRRSSTARQVIHRPFRSGRPAVGGPPRSGRCRASGRPRPCGRRAIRSCGRGRRSRRRCRRATGW